MRTRSVSVNRRFISAATLLMAMGAPRWGHATEASALSCFTPGSSVGFFNGMWTAKRDAESTFVALRSTLNWGNTFTDGRPISYQLFYNFHAGQLADLAEVFTQRIQEQGLGVLDNRWELYWEVVRGETGPGSILGTLSDAYSGFGQLRDTLGLDADEMHTEELDDARLTPPTLDDEYATHRALLDEHIAANESLVLIGHSQGSLFMNAAYEYASTQVSPDSVKTVDVAPASTHVNGDYVLSDRDHVIQGLRLISAEPVVPANVSVAANPPSDLALGHDLILTYLNPSLETYTPTHTAMTVAMQSATSPQTPLNCSGLECSDSRCVPPSDLAALTVITQVHGGPRVPEDFTTLLQGAMQFPGSPGFPLGTQVPYGSSSGVTFVTLGFFGVGEAFLDPETQSNEGYSVGFSGKCFGALAPGEWAVCKIRNCYEGFEADCQHGFP